MSQTGVLMEKYCEMEVREPYEQGNDLMISKPTVTWATQYTVGSKDAPDAEVVYNSEEGYLDITQKSDNVGVRFWNCWPSGRFIFRAVVQSDADVGIYHWNGKVHNWKSSKDLENGWKEIEAEFTLDDGEYAHFYVSTHNSKHNYKIKAYEIYRVLSDDDIPSIEPVVTGWNDDHTEYTLKLDGNTVKPNEHCSAVKNDNGSYTFSSADGQKYEIGFSFPEEIWTNYDFRQMRIKYKNAEGFAGANRTNKYGDSYPFWNGEEDNYVNTNIPDGSGEMTFSVKDEKVVDGKYFSAFRFYDHPATSKITIESITLTGLTEHAPATPEPTLSPTPEPTQVPGPIFTREPGELYGINSPRVEGSNIIWDCITLGSYYQSLYEPKRAPASPTEGTEYVDSDGTGMMYMSGKYYKSEPIRWRVLSVDGYDAFVIADRNIDSQPYAADNCSSASWENSSIRSWLNDEFYMKAFDEAERSTIREVALTNGSNPQYGTSGGADTNDYIYLPSLDDINNKDYGFAVDYDNNSKTRQASNTDYALARGAWNSNTEEYAGNGWWWLRSPGNFEFDAAYVGSKGDVDCSGYIVVNAGGGIRPAMHVDLRSASWIADGTVSIDAVSDLTPAPEPTENPVEEVDLSAVSIDSSCGYFSDSDDSIHIDDRQTEQGDTTFLYLPIPVTVAPGERIRVTVFGSSWGTSDFRIWTTPQGGEGSGDFVEDSSVFLEPTVNADGSFVGTVELTAKGKDCNRITLKPTWGVKIKNLVITGITVEHLNNAASTSVDAAENNSAAVNGNETVNEPENAMTYTMQNYISEPQTYVAGGLDTAEKASGNIRRPISPQQPMWIVHIDSWNYADPAKIIDLVPKDILPYVVFNISLSINWDNKNKKWLMVQDGYETAKSWLRTCAEKGVWATIQPASGGQCHFPDYKADDDLENTIFAEFFRDYPNFLGYNYCEQFWGFEQESFPISCQDRYRHFAALLKLCNKYGGYLNVSWCANQWSPSINPLAMLKQIPEWEAACRQYSENFILEEKYTQVSYISDVESLVYGYYISGYCDNFGVRYDSSGWTDSTWDGTGDATHDQYRLSTGLPIHLERLAFNGATVIDGPELIWTDDFMETNGFTDSDGYRNRQWKMFDQFQNDMIDMFRKIIDGTIRIPTREEVIERTKVAVIQDVNSGSNDNKYSTYPTLFEGLYRMKNDGNLKDNYNLYKSTGRYPTIPTVYSLADDLAKSIKVPINQSAIPSRWKTIEDKQNEFNELFPEEYYGNCYAGRYDNSWLAYNPNKDGAVSAGYIIPKYNTCSQVELSYTEYSSCFMKEHPDYIDFYINNYDEDDSKRLKSNTIKIYGAATKPEYTYKKRGVNQAKSKIAEKWDNGVYTLTINHNGPVDICIKCSGKETDRLTSYKTASPVAPEFPKAYTGTRQYEAEFFDYKNISELVKNGCNSDSSGFQGQGYMKFGTRADAAVKDTVTNNTDGSAVMTLRYAATEDINNVDLYVNNEKVCTLSLPKGESFSDWKTVTQQISLKEGDNKVELKATSELAGSLYIDNFTIDNM